MSNYSNTKELANKIERIKKEKNALILVHNYQPLEIQAIGDIVGDSLQLAQEAAKAEASIILMCGVKFMAETAKLLCPDSKVLLSHAEAGCPMADMITAEQLKAYKESNPGYVVVCYVNSSIGVKAESDICCTSSNALRVVASIPEDKKILFVPDQNLGTYVAHTLKREITVWQGYCNVHHHFITMEDIDKARSKYPDYKLLIHPECPHELVKRADLAASTKGIADFTAGHDKVIIGTECGLYEQLKAKYPEKNIVPLSERAICKNMKKSTLQDVYDVLATGKNEIFIEPDVAVRALRAVNRMLEVK